MGYGGGGGGGGGSGGSGGGGGGYGAAGAGGGGASGGSGYRRVGDDRTAPGLKVNNITNRTESGGPEVDGIVEINSTAHFIPPVGTTAERGSRGRGLFTGGDPSTDRIDYITIATTGNAIDFGDLTVIRQALTGMSSPTRSLFVGGALTPNPIYNIIDFVTIASTGNAQDFGDLNAAKGGCFSMASSTRALFGGGETPATQAPIDYVEIATTGNGIDFGDITSASKTLAGGMSNGHGGL